MTSRLIVVCLVMLMALVGCSSSAVKTQYYTLHPQNGLVGLSQEEAQINEQQEAQTNVPANTQADALLNPEKIDGSLGIGPVNLPEAIQQPSIVSYGEQNRLLVASGHLWSGDLKRSLSRVLAADIGRLLNKTDVWTYPWDMQPRPQHRIAVDIQTLGGTLGDTAVLRARWTLSSGSSRQMLGVEQIELQTGAGDGSHNDYVAAINQLANQLSAAIAASAIQYFQ